MSMPPNTATMLRTGEWDLPGDDHECEGAAFHSPRPLFTESTHLTLSEWFETGFYSRKEAWQGSPSAWLCGTCRDNLYVLLQMLHATDGDLGWPVRREFGNDLRALALRGWQWFAETRPAESVSSPG